MANTIESTNNNCHVCDNFVFDKSTITVSTTNGKIKLCSKICFEKYDIAIQQKQFRTRRVKAEKKEAS